MNAEPYRHVIHCSNLLNWFYYASCLLSYVIILAEHNILKGCVISSTGFFFLFQNITTVLEKFGSNIIFFNGLLDPWSGGGWANITLSFDPSHFIALIFYKLPCEHCSVLKNISESVIAIVAPLGTVLSPVYLQCLYAIHLYFLVLVTQNRINQCLFSPYLMQSDTAS